MDFQNVRIQEVQARGCIPRSVDIILRAEAVETAQPRDRCVFVGSFIVVPDVGAINMPGAQAETSNRHKGEQAEGVLGLKSLGLSDSSNQLLVKLEALFISIRCARYVYLKGGQN